MPPRTRQPSTAQAALARLQLRRAVATGVLIGDCRETLYTLPPNSVHVVVTSPPYWGLRAYDGDHPGEIGREKTPAEYVDHLVAVFRAVRHVLRADGVAWLNIGDSFAHDRAYQVSPTKWPTLKQGQPSAVPPGLKPGDLVGIPWLVAHALQADGWYLRSDVVWHSPNHMPEPCAGWRWEACRIKVKNLRGDKTQDFACGSGRGDGDNPGGGIDNLPWATYEPCPGCAKCAPNGGLVLRRGAWRPARSHEYVFQLAKSPDYFCDGEPVREPHTILDSDGNHKWTGKSPAVSMGVSAHKLAGRAYSGVGLDPIKEAPGLRSMGYSPAGRVLRDVWSYPEQIVGLRADLTPEQRAWVVQELLSRGLI